MLQKKNICVQQNIYLNVQLPLRTVWWPAILAGSWVSAPIGSYLPEENIRMDSKIEIFSPSVLHHFKTLMLSQPKIGLFIWKDLIQAIGSHSKSTTANYKQSACS